MLITCKEGEVTLNLWEASSAAVIHIIGHRRNISELTFRIPYYCNYIFNLYLLMRGDVLAVLPLSHVLA